MSARTHVLPPSDGAALRQDAYFRRTGRDAIGGDRAALDAAVRLFAEAVGAESAMLVERPMRGETPRLVSTWDRGDPGAGVPWLRSRLLADALKADRAVVELGGDRADAPGVVAVACPVRLKGRTLGAIHAQFESPTALDCDELSWEADAFAHLVALCVAGDRGVEGLLRASRTDALTGCLSYEGLLDVLAVEMRRSERQWHDLSCCFLDLDGFKRVNDSRGHLEGNRVIAAVGLALRRSARTYDAVARFGGDEFVVVLPETDARGACAMAVRLQLAVREAIASETPVPIDVSIGVAGWDREGAPAALLDAADAALRAAKRHGGRVATRPIGESRFEHPLAHVLELVRRAGGVGQRPEPRGRRA